MAGKRGKQQTIPGTDTELSKAVDDFLDNKMSIAELKVKQEELCDKILVEMKKEGREQLAVPHDGEIFLFEIIVGEDKLKVAKTTKTPVSPAQTELAGVK